MNKHHVIVIPGLGDRKVFNRSVLNLVMISLRRNSDFSFSLFFPDWMDGEDFSPKLDRLLKIAREKSKTGKVSLIGMSAGGPTVFNALVSEPKMIYKAVNVCGRLKRGNSTLLNLEKMATGSPAFKQAVLQFEKSEPKLNADFRKRFMTIRPAFGDEIVPADTVELSGATNTLVYSGEHLLSIFLALQFPKNIIQFLSS